MCSCTVTKLFPSALYVACIAGLFAGVPVVPAIPEHVARALSEFIGPDYAHLLAIDGPLPLALGLAMLGDGRQLPWRWLLLLLQQRCLGDRDASCIALHCGFE